MRISRDQLHLSIAQLISMRGTCRRAQVGAVLTLEGRIVASGYNGPLPNNPDCIEGICDASKGCTRAVHAEANAIAYAARFGIPLKGSILYCTHSPCIKCAELIIQAGITKVIYSDEYRIKDGIDLLKDNNVETCHQELSNL